MMKFRGQEGKTYKGITYRGVVEDMRDRSMSESRSLRHYMKQVSGRCKLYRPCRIRWWLSSEVFVKDLVQYGFMKEVKK